MDDIEARILKLEVLFESYSQTLGTLMKKIDAMTNNINKIREAVDEGQFNDKTNNKLFIEIQDVFQSISFTNARKIAVGYTNTSATDAGGIEFAIRILA